MRQYYLHSRKGIMYVQFVDSRTKKCLPALSTRKTNRDEALLVVYEWLQNGIPQKRKGEKGVRSVQEKLSLAQILYGLKTVSLKHEDILKIEKILQDQGLIVKIIQKSSASPTIFIDFLLEFWDYDKSPYIKEKLALKSRMGRGRANIMTARVKKYWAPYFKNMLLYIISCMTHFVIPLCLEYIRSYRNVSANVFLIESFQALFPIAQTIDKEHLIPIDSNERPVDIYQKLYSFVEHKVKQTFKSDALMWERQAYLGVNYKTTIEDTVNKIITNIIPEYQFNGNIISLNTSVIRISIQDYTLRKKDPFNIKCFVDADPNTQSDDNNIITEAEQFDSYSSNHDEFAVIIRHTFAQDTVNKILIRKEIVIDPNEFQYYKDTAHDNRTVQTIHEFQRFTIFAAFYQYFGGTENIYGVNLEQWITLMLAICDMLRKNGIPELCKYVTGVRNKHYIQKKEARISRQQLYLDPMYNYIISTKYRSIKSIIDKKKNFIESNILLLTTNEYTYNVPDNNLNGKVIVRNDDEIRRGVLSFFQNIIN